MTLSTSRQQFLAYETHGAAAEDIQYGRRGGLFISHCICIGFIIFAILVAVVVGVIAHFITYFKLNTEKNVAYWDETEPFGQASSPALDLRLPSVVVPSFYRLRINANLDNSNFSGEVAITLRASQRVKVIILHAKQLSINSNAKLTEQIYEKVETINPRSKREADINSSSTEPSITSNPSTNDTGLNTTDELSTTTLSTTTVQPVTVETQVTHSDAQSVKILDIQESTGDRLIITLASTLKPDVDYILELNFQGKIGDSLNGFYKSAYKNKDGEDKVLGVTQFEPTSARAAFPCFDEPAFKARFEISIAHTKNVSVLSNMRVSAEEPMPDQPGWVWTHFERSVAMSTYLVAYVLSDFQALETSYLSKDNVTKVIKVWTRPEFISKAKYAAAITPKLLEYYESVFGVPYALDKLDLIAIPDFSSGAMENWGLITFRETTLLFAEEGSGGGVPLDKQNVCVDVAHEVAHQWFGNLVTMRWWNDLWLNEGFATYIEYVGVDKVEPEWKMFESFTRDKMDLLRTDALKNTSPVARDVVDASEISQKFNEISYLKGANLIRMLNHTVSEELFHKGLLIYLNDWKFTNAVENDLWTAMSKATTTEPSLKDLDIVKFMNSWTRQAGFPVVKVNRNYVTGYIEFEQRLFTNAKDPYQSMIDQLWHIPISYTTVDLPLDQWSTKPKTWLNERIHVVKTPVNVTQALYVNIEAIGYYRVNYDQKNWQLLSSALKSGQIQSPIAKAQLMDDAFNLAKIGHLNYSYALGLTTCMIDGEDSKIVWDLLLNNMAFLKYNLRATAGFVYFQDYMKLLLKKQLEKLNYGLDKPKNDNEAFLIENLVMWECYVESPRCLDWARTQFESWMGNPNNNTIPKYLRSLVYSTAVRYGGRREFDFVWNMFNNATDPNEKSLLVNVLPYTREESLIVLLLERSLSEIPKQYAVAAWSVQPAVGARLAQRFLLDHFQRVYQRFSAIDNFMFPAVLNAAFGFITGDDELAELKSFALEHKPQLLAMSQTLQKLVDTATLRVHWVGRHAAGITRWLRDYVAGKLQPDGSSTTASPPSTVSAASTTDNVTIANSTSSTNATTANPTR